VRNPIDSELTEEARLLLAQLQSVYERAADVLGEDEAKNVWVRALVGHDPRSLKDSIENTQAFLAATGRRQRKQAGKKAKADAARLQLSIKSPSKSEISAAKGTIDNMVTIPGVPVSAVLPDSKNCTFTITQSPKLGRVLRIQGDNKSAIEASVKAISAPKWWAILKLSTPFIHESNWQTVIPRKFVYRLISQTCLSIDQVGEAIHREFGIRTSWVQRQDDHMFIVVIPFPESVLKVIGQNKNGIGLTHLDIVKAATTGKESPASTVTMSVVSPRSPRLAWKTDSESTEKKAKSSLVKELGGYSRSAAEVEKLAFADNKHLHVANRGIGRREAWR